MDSEMNRREVFKMMTIGAGAWFARDVMGGRPEVRTPVAIPESDRIVVTVITDNLADALGRDDRIAKRHVSKTSALDGLLHAEHGLAYHVETTVNGRPHAFLFDFGADFHGISKNIERLGLDLTKVEALALSHDHLDHQAALMDLLAAWKTRIPVGTPFYVGEGFFQGTYMKRSDGSVESLLALDKDSLEALGLLRIVETTVPTPIVEGAFLTGRIERTTDFERIPPAFVVKKGDQFVQEEFPGEQAVVMNARGKGLVVLSGCAHRGIVNTVLHARKMTGIDRVHAVIGGFHLAGAKPEVVLRTISDIKAIGPDYVVPTHCTGFDAISMFAREMPGPFILNTAGTRYVIEK